MVTCACGNPADPTRVHRTKICAEILGDYPLCTCGHRHDRHRDHGTPGCYECPGCKGYSGGPEADPAVVGEPVAAPEIVYRLTIRTTHGPGLSTTESFRIDSLGRAHATLLRLLDDESGVVAVEVGGGFGRVELLASQVRPGVIEAALRDAGISFSPVERIPVAEVGAERPDGLNAAEGAVMDALVEAWNRFTPIGDALVADDRKRTAADFCDAIHRALAERLAAIGRQLVSLRLIPSVREVLRAQEDAALADLPDPVEPHPVPPPHPPLGGLQADGRDRLDKGDGVGAPGGE